MSNNNKAMRKLRLQVEISLMVVSQDQTMKWTG